MRPPYEIVHGPLITEKGTLLAEKGGQLVFKVDLRASKLEIRRAISELFGVQVESVRTARFLGKRVRRGLILGRRSDWKKAYVTLAPGQTIDALEQA